MQTQSQNNGKYRSESQYDFSDGFIDDEDVIQRKTDIILSTKDDYFGLLPEEFHRNDKL